jgi:hypothetical protein
MKMIPGLLLVCASLVVSGQTTSAQHTTSSPAQKPVLKEPVPKDVGSPAVTATSSACVLRVNGTSVQPASGGLPNAVSLDLLVLCPDDANAAVRPFVTAAPSSKLYSPTQVSDLLANTLKATQYAVSAGLSSQDQIDDAVSRVRTAALAELRTELVKAYTAEVKAYQDRIKALEDQVAALTAKLK